MDDSSNLYAPLRKDCPPCSGSCNQGRNCPARDACWLPEPERELKDWGDAFVEICIVVLVVFVLAAVAASI